MKLKKKIILFVGKDAANEQRIDAVRVRREIGLPFDHDGDPSTPTVLPSRPSENDLRAELGLPLRTRY